MSTAVMVMEVRKSQIQVNDSKQDVVDAIIRAFDRMGLFVEARAVHHAPAFSGQLRQEIHKTEVDYNRATHTLSVRVVANAAHSLYVEMGFQGHFVPFHVADSLYYQAMRQWGWRIPTVADYPIEKRKPGRLYLIPRGRKSPVWGVYVPGKAQPFLRPAMDEFNAAELDIKILREEIQKALATRRAQ